LRFTDLPQDSQAARPACIQPWLPPGAAVVRPLHFPAAGGTFGPRRPAPANNEFLVIEDGETLAKARYIAATFPVHIEDGYVIIET